LKKSKEQLRKLVKNVIVTKSTGGSYPKSIKKHRKNSEYPKFLISENGIRIQNFFMVFGYGQQRQAYPNSINGGTLFFPMVWHYPGECVARINRPLEVENDTDGFPHVQTKEVFRLQEALHTEWDKSLVREQLATFIDTRVKRALVQSNTSLVMRHNTEEKLREPSVVQMKNGRWGLGEVDLIVTNIGKTPVRLQRLNANSDNGRSADIDAAATEKLDEVAAAELKMVSLAPGTGRRFYTAEKERWEATSQGTGRVIARRTIDCAMGVVQDWVVGKFPASKKSKAAAKGNNEL